jgi:hypothetical protein
VLLFLTVVSLCVCVAQEILLRLIQCNDMVFGNDTGPTVAADSSRPSGSSSSDADSIISHNEDDGSALQQEKAYVFSTKNLEASYLAETLLCYVSIVSHMAPEQLDDVVLDKLCDLVEQLVHVFPNMVTASDGARAIICRSVLCLFFALRDKGSALSAVLNRLVFPALVRTLATATTDVFIHPVTGLPDNRVLFEYIPMWREWVQPKDKVTRLLLHGVLENHSMANVLARPIGTSQAERVMLAGLDDMDWLASSTLGPDVPSSSGDGSGTDDGDEEDGVGAAVHSVEGDVVADSPSLNAALRPVVSRLFDSVLAACLRILGEVDLGLQPREGVGEDDDLMGQHLDGAILPVADMEALQPRVAKDFSLFLNLVEFMTYFLSLAPHDLFRPWAFVFFKQVIIGSNRYPNVSGFYKLLTVGVYVSDSIGVWSVPFVPTVDLAAASVADAEAAVGSATTAVYCRQLVARFASEVASRIRQYKEELLVCCVKFLLSLPVGVSGPAVVAPALNAALVAGTSHSSSSETF